jgi:hypothetical protein
MAKCPYFRKPCLEHGCTHYVQLHGRDPQTGKQLSEWVCLDHAMLKAQLEGNKETRQGAAATESFRNEVAAAAQRRLEHDERKLFIETVAGDFE